MQQFGYLQVVVEVERQVIAWFEVDDPDLFKENFPISIITGTVPQLLKTCCCVGVEAFVCGF